MPKAIIKNIQINNVPIGGIFLVDNLISGQKLYTRNVLYQRINRSYMVAVGIQQPGGRVHIVGPLGQEVEAISNLQYSRSCRYYNYQALVKYLRIDQYDKNNFLAEIPRRVRRRKKLVDDETIVKDSGRLITV